MPLLPLIQVVISRVIIAIVAIFATLGLGSISDHSIEPTPTQKNPIVVSEDTLKEPETTPEITPTEQKTEEKITEVSPITTPPKTTPVTPPELQTPVSESATVPIETQTPPTDTPLSFSYINTETSKALVNILCSQNIPSAVSPITGSGVIIDPRGIVITNAHVAQFFLLRDYPEKDGISCILRTGSPAHATYTAELFYIPPIWVSEHAQDITNTAPTGTGENDYAFLRITGRTDPQADFPTTFPYVSLGIDTGVTTGEQVLVAAYPAGFLGGISIQKDLYAVSSVTTVGERFTFDTNTVDLFSAGGTVVSQGGSSGGAVVSSDNKLIGIIVTSTRADATADRDLRAITLGHINRSLFTYANTTIEALLFGDVSLRAHLFTIGTAPTLANMLLKQLAK